MSRLYDLKIYYYFYYIKITINLRNTELWKSEIPVFYTEKFLRDWNVYFETGSLMEYFCFLCIILNFTLYSLAQNATGCWSNKYIIWFYTGRSAILWSVKGCFHTDKKIHLSKVFHTWLSAFMICYDFGKQNCNSAIKKLPQVGIKIFAF